MSPLVPILVLVVLPVLYGAYRAGWLARRAGRWAVGGAVLVVAAFSLPYEGVDFLYIKRLNLFLAAAVAGWLGWQGTRSPQHWPRHARSRHGLLPLAALTLLAVVAYLNFFSFHGARTFVHLHDVAHYYLGSKYYGELGHTDLYTAMLRAEAELYDNHFKSIEARNLETYELVHIRSLLVQSGPVKDAFTPPRWEAFKQDVDYFRNALGPHYGGVLIDHGFNPTPLWALIGGTLAGWVPAGSGQGILLLTLLDPLLLLLTFLAVGWAFGGRMMLLAVLHFTLTFGATFGWTGGAFLRYLWFFGVVVGACCLYRRRYGAAGVLFALAAGLRIFPIFFLFPLVAKALWRWWQRRTLPRRYRNFFGAFALSGALLLGLTALLPQGLTSWSAFRTNTQNQLRNISPNMVGLTAALAYHRGPQEVTQEEFTALKVRREKIYRLQLAFLFLPLVVMVAWGSRRRSDLGALALGLPLLLAGLSLAAYYYVFLVLLLFAHRGAPRRLALVFAVEAACYALMLFEEREALRYLYRGLLLLYLYAALVLPPLTRRLWGARRPAAA